MASKTSTQSSPTRAQKLASEGSANDSSAPSSPGMKDQSNTELLNSLQNRAQVFNQPWEAVEKVQGDSISIATWKAKLKELEDAKSANKKLSNELKSITFGQENKMTYFQFSKAIIKAAKKTALSPEEKSKGWYIYSKDIIQPLVDKRSEVLNSIRQNVFSDEDAISFAREARKNVMEETDLAKKRWSSHLTDRIHQMAKKSRDSWQAIKP